MVGEREGASRRGSWIAAVATIAATYFYFLIFAEFALLELVRGVVGDRLRWVMLTLGVGGITGGFAAVRLLRGVEPRALLAWLFRAAAAGAIAMVAAANGATALFVALVVGGSLGALTVTLSSELRRATGGRRLGLAVGIGTGTAYAACNVPILFHATAAAQALVAATVAAVASFAPGWMNRGAGEERIAGSDFRPTAVAGWIVALLALVWMDSAAFFIIQHTPALRAGTWSAELLAGNAGLHAGGALLAGRLLDAGARVGVTATAAVLLAGACAVLNGVGPSWLPPSWPYAVGVSFYSTVLVEYPAQSGRATVAALVFALAGWLGSALGIGMAQDLATIPAAFIAIAVVAVMAALVWRGRGARVGATALVVLLAVEMPRAQAGEAELIGRGRDVYMAEGCIHCHSQFIRPRAPLEVERWGPGKTLTQGLASKPPLFGTRRQGPDLSQVGNRRSPEWNRLHLMEPAAVSPGSRMPSYAHLFVPGEERGDALVAYLESLGRETREARQAMIAQWTPRAGAVLSVPEAGRRFQQLCTPCHGVAGRGDGVLASRLSLRPPDWTRDPWRRVPSGPDLETALARIIKFGLPGSPMAGHEYLPDGDVVGLARFVRTLHSGGSDGRSVAVRP